MAGWRLVTLTGAGGAGKTRLGLQVAAGLADGAGTGCGSPTWPHCRTRVMVPVTRVAWIMRISQP
jgi:hypothetical protein